MRNVGAVIGREYLQRVRRKAFILSTIAVPLLVMGFVTVPVLLGARGAAAERNVALVDHTGVLADRLADRLGEVGYDVEVITPGSPAEDETRLRVAERELAGMIEVDGATLERGVVRWTGESPPSTIRGLGIRQAASRTALEILLQDIADEDVTRLLAGGTLDVVTLDASTSEEDARATGMAAGFLGGFLLYFVLLVYGTMVMRAVLEEKTGRIVEIIVSSVRPWELMLGKILGVGAVGLTQLAVWLTSGALIVALGLPAMLAAVPDEEILGEVARFLPGIGVLAFFLLCFLFGYFIYASLFAAVGAMCSTEEEAQQLQFPVVMLVAVPMLLLMPVLERPESVLAVSLSLFPFFSPILMFARVAGGAAAPWEAMLSVLGMAVALLATAWIAGRIYRTGILMQGKRPTLPELWRWLREA